MLAEGRRRSEATAFADRLDWVVGDAMALPFPNASFDAYTISFGIRNVTRIGDALAEAFRVLRPGGRLLVDSKLRGGVGDGGCQPRADVESVVGERDGRCE